MSTILSLDITDINKAKKLIRELENNLAFIKLGHIPFSSFSRDDITMLSSKIPLFFDFKLHDIPNTVNHSIKSYKQQYPNLKLITIWTQTSKDMVQSALEAHQDVDPLGVISLTSDNLDESKFLQEIERNINFGLKKFICPPTIVAKVSQEFQKEITLYCPGIRFNKNSNDDQKQIMHPNDALSLGADYVIIGRPLLEATEPLELIKTIN